MQLRKMPTGPTFFVAKKEKRPHLILDLSFYLFLAIQFYLPHLKLQKHNANNQTFLHNTDDKQASYGQEKGFPGSGADHDRKR
uniref:Uncharacterized protein n=1 Tax=Setaria italica TaxID=4555 RepID=K3ZGB7_SETIT